MHNNYEQTPSIPSHKRKRVNRIESHKLMILKNTTVLPNISPSKFHSKVLTNSIQVNYIFVKSVRIWGYSGPNAEKYGPE